MCMCVCVSVNFMCTSRLYAERFQSVKHVFSACRLLMGRAWYRRRSNPGTSQVSPSFSPAAKITRRKKQKCPNLTTPPPPHPTPSRNRNRTSPCLAAMLCYSEPPRKPKRFSPRSPRPGIRGVHRVKRHDQRRFHKYDEEEPDTEANCISLEHGFQYLGVRERALGPTRSCA